MADEQITFDKAHQIICDQLKEKFPLFVHVGDYETLTVRQGQTRQRLIVPAAFLNMESFEPDSEKSDTGTGQKVFTVRWELRIVLDKDSPCFDRDLRKLAADVALWLDGNRFGGFQAKFIRAEPDQFEPRLVMLKPWLIEFEQSYLLGESVWDEDGITPSEVYGSYDPEIGEAHEKDYEPIEDVKHSLEG